MWMDGDDRGRFASGSSWGCGGRTALFVINGRPKSGLNKDDVVKNITYKEPLSAVDFTITGVGIEYLVSAVDCGGKRLDCRWRRDYRHREDVEAGLAL
ncbi:hypothetical protein L484_015420 [Morus notabilis]|uniref:Uncharacterized protein n=1 Tax=Morus notabilis TaxID=981085 RepID=W9S4Y2_9ROSA|nr:hypothetical protein L484_015420 [Morus notabilis]